MKNFVKIIACIILCTHYNVSAQNKLLSTKLLQGSGLEEIYQVSAVEDGYLCIGLKGDEAVTKKLWLVKLNNKLQMQYSNIVTNKELADPFKILNLPNGQSIILAQETNMTDFLKKSIVLCTDKNGNVLWAKNLNLPKRTYLTDASLAGNNEIVLCGITEHELKKGKDATDKLNVVKIDFSGDLIWHKTYELGNAEINPKNIIYTSNQNIIISGAYTQLSEIFIPENKAWFAAKFSTDGTLEKSILVNDYSAYNHAQGITEFNNNYVAILNKSNYYGDAAIVTLNYNLQLQNAVTLNGTPMLLSGVFPMQDQLIISGVFSNTVNHYAPGFVSINKNVVKAKSSRTLFKYFFVTNTNTLENNQFMLNGIGYSNNEPSDVYMLPFAANGQSACEMDDVKMKTKHIDLETIEMPICKEINLVNNNSKKTSLCNILTATSTYHLTDICTAPDDLIIEAKNNKNWGDWEKNNAKTFEVPKITEWLQIYPNPSNGKITISYRGTANQNGLLTKIFNSQGVILYNEIIKNQDVFDLDISMHPNGTYYVKVHDGIEEKMQKIVKE